MHSAILVDDESSLEELNQLLADGGWWIQQIAPGGDGSWLVVVTDQNPDSLVEYDETDRDELYSS